MHITLVKSAPAVVLAAIVTSSLAAVAPRQPVPTNDVTCTDDALYKGFFSNSQIVYDVQTFCSQDLGLTASTVCDHSLTTRTTIYPSGTSVTRTITATTTAYDTTVTVTETGVVYGLPHKKMVREAAPGPAPEAQITAAPKIVRDILKARAVEKRQGTQGFNANSAAAQVYSTCECGYLAGFVTADTSYLATCYPYTSTVTANQVKYVPTTVYTTAEGSITTITVTQNYTSNIISAISAMNTSQPQWTGTWTGSWNGSWTDWSGPPTINPTTTSESTLISPTMASQTTSSLSMSTPTNISPTMSSTTSESPTATSSTWAYSTSFPVSTSSSSWIWSGNGSSLTSPVSPITPSTTNSEPWTGTWTSSNWSSPISPVMPSTTSPWTTTTVSSSTSSPTIEPSGCPYINGTTYTPPGSCDIYTRVCGLSFEDKDFYDIFPYYPTPEMCTELCEANSNGMSPCLGIVWNTSAVAGSHQSNCRQIKSLADPIKDSTSIALILTGQDPSCQKGVSISSSSTISSNGTANPTGPIWTGNTTWSFPTGTEKPSYTRSHNYTSYTRSYNHTRTPKSMKTTTSTYTTSTMNYPNTTLTTNSTNISPYMPSTTSYSNTTWSTNATSTSIKWTTYSTSSGTAPVSPTLPTTNSTCPVATVTSVSTQYATLYNNATVTLDQVTVTVFATNITTVMLTTTTTDTRISTEIDVIITTETDTETTTQTDLSTITKTTTETDTSTFTTTTTTTTTEAAPPRYGRVWHGAWRA